MKLRARLLIKKSRGKKKKKDKQAKRTFSMDKENNFSYATMINHQRRKEFFGLAQRGR